MVRSHDADDRAFLLTWAEIKLLDLDLSKIRNRLK